MPFNMMIFPLSSDLVLVKAQYCISLKVTDDIIRNLIDWYQKKFPVA
jgi:hypothetical protein